MRLFFWTIFALSAHASAGEITVTPGDAKEFSYVLSGRQVPGVAVPYLTPKQPGMPVALDIFPSGSPDDFTKNTGVSWIDLCHTDILANGLKTKDYGCLRMGVTKEGAAHIGHAVGGKEPVRDLGLQINGGNVGVGTMEPKARIDIASGNMRLANPNPPKSSSSPCHKGEISWSEKYIFVCVADDRWARSNLMAF